MHSFSWTFTVPNPSSSPSQVLGNIWTVIGRQQASGLQFHDFSCIEKCEFEQIGIRCTAFVVDPRLAEFDGVGLTSLTFLPCLTTWPLTEPAAGDVTDGQRSQV